MEERYRSVQELLEAGDSTPDLAAKVRKHVDDRRLIKKLVLARVALDMTQQGVAERMGCTQSRISKFEMSQDVDLKFGDVVSYAAAVGLRLDVDLIPRRADMK